MASFFLQRRFMISKFFDILWGHLSRDELRKFTLCSITFMLLVGSYWLLRVLKDALFDDLVGIVHQPKAKILSMIVIVPLVLIYTRLVDTVERHKLFFWICTSYSVLFSLILYCYTHPLQIFYTSFLPGNIIGWITYVSVESFGSLAIGLFWAFMASTTNTASAKRGYPMIYTIGQLGTIATTTMVTKVQFIGFTTLWAGASCAVFIVPFVIMLLLTTVPQETMQSNVKTNIQKKEKTGLFEGLRLLSTKPYLLGILVISTFYEVVVTIMEFQMKMLARQIYTTRETFAAFLGTYGQATNLLAFAFALFGTGIIVRTFGVRFCLVMFPLVSGTIVSATLFNPSLSIIFAAAMITKALSYTLNNPVKELMYIPTSKDVKFKTKSWIEAFGARGSKGTGATVCAIFANDLPYLITFGTIASLSVISVWATVAFLVGTQYNRLIKEEKIIE